MNTLVIGGTGFISSLVVRHLRERNHRVTVLTRGITARPAELPSGVTFATGDRSDVRVLQEAAGSGTFDIVYDMVAYLPGDSAAAARVFRGKVGRFIHCSTISVYMVSNNVQCPITEDQDKGPLMEYDPRNPFGMDYGIQKRECEAVLWNAHDSAVFPVTMLRPVFVSGPRDPAKRDYFWIERIRDGKPLLVPGSGDIAFQQVYVDDVARIFAALADVPNSVGKAYNITGEEIFSLNDYLAALGELLGKQPEIVHVDQATFDALPFSRSAEGDVFTFNTRRTAVFSLDRIKRDLGYRATPFPEYMQTTIDWWTDPGRGHSHGYSRRAEELDFIQKVRRQ